MPSGNISIRKGKRNFSKMLTCNGPSIYWWNTQLCGTSSEYGSPDVHLEKQGLGFQNMLSSNLYPHGLGRDMPTGQSSHQTRWYCQMYSKIVPEQRSMSLYQIIVKCVFFVKADLGKYLSFELASLWNHRTKSDRTLPSSKCTFLWLVVKCSQRNAISLCSSADVHTFIIFFHLPFHKGSHFGSNLAWLSRAVLIVQSTWFPINIPTFWQWHVRFFNLLTLKSCNLCHCLLLVAW